MNLLKNLTIVAVAGLVAQANAITVDSSYLLGTVDPGSPADPASQTARLQFLAGQYNFGTPSGVVVNPGDLTHTYNLDPGSQVPAPALPTPIVDAAGNLGANLGGSFSLNLGSGFDYLLVKWGNIGAYYYVGALSGTVTVQNDIVLNRNGQPNGGSHYALYNRHPSVPDAGTSIGLLGATLAGLGVMRRFPKR